MILNKHSSFNSESECKSKGWSWFEISDANDPDGANLCASMDVNRDCSLDVDLEENIVNYQSQTFTESWRNLDGLEWSLSNGYYKNSVSDEQIVSATVSDVSDIYNKYLYWSIIDSFTV